MHACYRTVHRRTGGRKSEDFGYPERVDKPGDPAPAQPSAGKF